MDTLKTVTTSRQVLEETPARALIFLRAAGTSAPITAALATRGYTPADHKQGWDLLHRVSGYDHFAVPVDTKAASEAIATLDAWDEPNFRIINVTLLRYAREQAAFVFHDLSPATGAFAILSVKTLLDRLDALEESPEREDTREEDHAALKHLEKKGYTKEERARLRGLIKTAESAADITALPGPAPDEAARIEDLEALRAWFVEWSETARVVIKRRDHLIRLGLAKRKAPKRDKASAGDATASARA